ncbi:MAG: sigma 54-interacting transcriptional regulator [Myxococcota bacterium]
MATDETTEPWPRMEDIVAAAVSGLHSGRFMEQTLEALCVAMGASSAWSTLETHGGGRLHRSRTASFRGVSPAVLAEHVTLVLSDVQTQLRTTSGRVPYAERGSFIAIPLWSRPQSARAGRSLVGALYMEFLGDQGTQPGVVRFVESVGTLIGGLIAQKTVIESSEENLRIERAKDQHEHYLELDELLRPDSMRVIRDEVLAAVRSPASVMILGESGTGKTQLATSFARASHRDPIVRATLGFADDLNTITSELFGHERGAFSGAVSKRQGLVEYADSGTLILDEVLNLPSNAQQLLLDFTQFGEYRPLGYQGRRPKTADVRIISVTNGDMSQAIAEKRFREDLYYRLATVPIVMPPLRERRQDIPRIAVRYLNRTDAHGEWELDGPAADLLVSPRLRWAGNIRELEAAMERARNRVLASGSDEPVVTVKHLDLPGASVAEEAPDPAPSRPGTPKDELKRRWHQYTQEKEGLEDVEKKIIEDTLSVCGGVVARAARILSLPRTGLISRLATLGIDADEFKD